MKKRSGKREEIKSFLEGFNCPACLDSEAKCPDCRPLTKVPGYDFGYSVFKGERHDRLQA